ncbi:8ee79419-bd96-49f7-bc53-35763a80c0cc [Sclerotinia trifoliorum]|uniref:chitinase n=1 Tax=Sclerotinia trifoliorum TaxID=28548 RepID=A0A8H2VZ81_9HELO|nr:8ee79419-bd96-49f7-bc53-35763a80c0cc [Sclerotinia trifoliorum]
MCSDIWKNHHPCPETAPQQPNKVPKGSTYGVGSFPPNRYNPNGLVMGQAGYNAIAALTVEGGIAGGATTYCAPANGKCSTNTVVVGTRSEQNFQSDAHSTLRLRVSGQNNPSGTWEFHFKTLWNDDRFAPATAIEWYSDPNTAIVDTWSKRRIPGPSHFMVDEIYGNGTIKTTGYKLTKQEISRIIKRRDESKKALILEQGTGEHPPAKQIFDMLPDAPVHPIIEITRSYIREQALEYLRASEAYLNQTLQAVGAAMSSSNAFWSRKRNRESLRDQDNKGVKKISTPRLVNRQTGAGSCSIGSPCSDGSCCNAEGKCGYGPDNCGDGCIYNCNATAACGQDGAGGSVKCPLDVCCSYYGFCGVESDFCNSPNPIQPCQTGFGSCQQIAAPTCGGNSASGRTIAYYQIGNVRNRECNRVTPAQIDTTGFTHLVLAFASINPFTFEVIPGAAADVAIYPDFTGLQSKELQTWVAIGGWDFNNPGPTQTVWGNIASSAANTAIFISSLKSFMMKYKFQGVNIDWEYPGAPDRGGKAEDTESFVNLLKQMRASFGTQFGISATLPASYWYLRWFDPIAMQPYVDFFGLMTYDLHGPWDASVSAMGKPVIGQTNIPEIYNWTLPLWYNGLDPSKINMGLAYYGRGYTLADSSCNHIGCKWSEPSLPGPCTNFGGVMSLQEINNIIIPQLGSIDLFSGAGSGNVLDGLGSGGGDPGSEGGQNGGGDSGIGAGSFVYIDPSIWTQSIQSSIASHHAQVAWSESGKLTTTIRTTILTIPPVTTTEIEVWAYSVTNSNNASTITSPFYVTSSVRPPPFTITDDPNPESSPGVTHAPVTRTITPPPYPYTFTTQNAETTSSKTTTPVAAIFPIVTFKPGKPGPICKSGCGSKCLIFCDHPCLLDCSNGGQDFPDPLDPSPSPKPTPKPIDDPLPPGKQDPGPTGDPNEDDPEDPDKEEEDDKCALELCLPVPTYDRPIGKPSATTSVASPPPPPYSKPPTPPAKPSPNPSTEKVHCYNSGAIVGRGDMINAINDFCGKYEGTVLDATASNSLHTAADWSGAVCVDNSCFDYISVSVTVINGCAFTIDGSSPSNQCGRILRRATDECDQSSTRFKQGGTITSNCATWLIDPNIWWD